MTSYLQRTLREPHIQRLEHREQFGVVIVVAYLRSPDFARFVLEASSKPQVSLLSLIHQFFRHTGGVGLRKAFLPTRVISKRGQKLRPNRDLAKLRLSSALRLCGQFLDGSLDTLFVNDSKKHWSVDPDLLLGSFCFPIPDVTINAHQHSFTSLSCNCFSATFQRNLSRQLQAAHD